MENKVKKLTLDYSKWRSGEEGPYMIGKGVTMLLNEEGFQCCLGLWCAQLGVSLDKLIRRGEPGDLDEEVPLFNRPFDETGRFIDNQLSNDCIGINDQIATTPEEKISLLSKRLAKEGIELEVINKPETL